MRRREFIGLLGGTAAVWPLTVRAQRPPLIGYLGSASPDEQRHDAFRRGLREQGFVDGGTVQIEFLFAQSAYDRLPGLIAELVRRRPTVILAGGNQAALAAKAANLGMPFVFVIGDDPVGIGLVDSLSNPAGNATGVTFHSVELAGKRLALLNALVPRDAMVAVLINQNSPNATAQAREVQNAARQVGRRVEIFHAGTIDELDKAFAAMVEQRSGGFFYGTDPFFNAERRRLIAFAARHRLPSIYSGREYMEAGALMAYGAPQLDAYRQAGIYIGRIMRGEKPSELPVMRPVRFELLLSLKTANALGVTFSPELLALADEVLE
jgi:ABC-type uncharacterized transport system substrate-binding protein